MYYVKISIKKKSPRKALTNMLLTVILLLTVD